jgi:hypothetical protein
VAQLLMTLLLLLSAVSAAYAYMHKTRTSELPAFQYVLVVLERVPSIQIHADNLNKHMRCS